jgi:hypothetical protein
MKKIFILVLFLFCVSGVLKAQSISDVSRKSGDYNSVKRIVRDGYLPLFSENKFNGNRSVSRKEFALAIDKILNKVDQKGLNLKKAEIQELVNLSKSFKKYLVNYDISRKLVTKQLGIIEGDQKEIHYDLSEIDYNVKKLKKENQDQFMYMIGGFLIAVAVGVAL